MPWIVYATDLIDTLVFVVGWDDLFDQKLPRTL